MNDFMKFFVFAALLLNLVLFQNCGESKLELTENASVTNDDFGSLSVFDSGGSSFETFANVGKTDIGTSLSKEFQLRNGGGQELIIKDIKLIPKRGQASAFTISTIETPRAIGEDDVLSVNLTFLAVQVGGHLAQMVIRYNDGEADQTRRIDIAGEGVSGDILLSATTTDQNCQDFEFSTGVSSFSTRDRLCKFTVTLQNTGSGNLALNQVEVEGEFVTLVAAESQSVPVDLIPGESRTFVIEAGRVGSGRTESIDGQIVLRTGIGLAMVQVLAVSFTTATPDNNGPGT